MTHTSSKIPRKMRHVEISKRCRHVKPTQISKFRGKGLEDQ